MSLFLISSWLSPLCNIIIVDCITIEKKVSYVISKFVIEEYSLQIAHLSKEKKKKKKKKENTGCVSEKLISFHFESAIPLTRHIGIFFSSTSQEKHLQRIATAMKSVSLRILVAILNFCSQNPVLVIQKICLSSKNFNQQLSICSIWGK